MIIKGSPVGSVKFWSKHLLRDDKNSRAEVVEISGLLAEDLPSALREMQVIAAQSRCKGNFMYQANINPLAHERLTPEQWRETVDTLEKNLGLEGHQRVVIEHEKDGRVHRHIVWNRVDGDTLRVADMGGNYYTHQRTARELEERFGLQRVQSLHGQRRENGRPDRPLELWEQRAAARSDINPQDLKAELTEIWRSTETGREFVKAVEERGYIVARGDRRDFCIIDQAGDAHSLARRIEGAKAKDLRERMADVDRDGLPSVTEARERQRARYTERQPKHEREQPARLEERAPPIQAVESQKAPQPKDIVRPGLMVADGATEIATTVVDFVCDLLGQRSRPSIPANQADRIIAQRRAAAALENIRDSMERGERLRAADLSRLTDTHLENIRLRGDDYIRYLVERMQSDRERDSWGRVRER